MFLVAELRVTEHRGRTSIGNVLAARKAESVSGREQLSAALHKVALGDHAALETVYLLTAGKLFALLRRMLPSEAVAEEVLQDVYMAVWKRAATYDSSIASPMTWLITIARNKAIDRLRSDPGLKEMSGGEQLMLHIVDPAPSVLARMEASERDKRLHRCLDELEERQRLFIRAAFFGGFTYDDLSRRTSVPLGTVKSYIRRGLIRLRNCLQS